MSPVRMPWHTRDGKDNVTCCTGPCGGLWISLRCGQGQEQVLEVCPWPRWDAPLLALSPIYSKYSIWIKAVLWEKQSLSLRRSAGRWKTSPVRSKQLTRPDCSQLFWSERLKKMGAPDVTVTEIIYSATFSFTSMKYFPSHLSTWTITYL